MIDHRDILRVCVHAFYAVIVVQLGWFLGLGYVVGPLGLGAGLALIWIMWSTVKILGRK